MTRGRRQLIALLQHVPAREVAVRVHVTKSCVSRWLSGSRIPCERARILLEAHLRIPVEAWRVYLSRFDRRP